MFYFYAPALVNISISNLTELGFLVTPCRHPETNEFVYRFGIQTNILNDRPPIHSPEMLHRLVQTQIKWATRVFDICKTLPLNFSDFTVNSMEEIIITKLDTCTNDLLHYQDAFITDFIIRFTQCKLSYRGRLNMSGKQHYHSHDCRFPVRSGALQQEIFPRTSAHHTLFCDQESIGSLLWFDRLQCILPEVDFNPLIDILRVSPNSIVLY